ncbi:MAG: hypothetical protein WCA08_20170 [Desulfoferrobacter sp.]
MEPVSVNSFNLAIRLPEGLIVLWASDFRSLTTKAQRTQRRKGRFLGQQEGLNLSVECQEVGLLHKLFLSLPARDPQQRKKTNLRSKESKMPKGYWIVRIDVTGSDE